MGVPREDEDTEFLEPGEEGWPMRDDAPPLADTVPRHRVESTALPAGRPTPSVLPWLLVGLLLAALAAAGGGAAVAVFGPLGDAAPAVEAAATGRPKADTRKHAATRKRAAASTTTTTPTQAQTDRVDVPRVVGGSQGAAIDALAAAGFKAKVELVFADGPRGRVLRQQPASGQALGGSTIVLSISKARPKPVTVTVPNVVGSTTSAAESAARARGLSVELRHVPSDLDRGTVVSQWPAAGATLPKGRSVLLNVSQGRPLVSVPGVIGEDAGSARAQLSGAGFAVNVTTRDVTDPAKDGVVVSQSPSPGAKREKGHTVTVTVGHYSSD